MLRAPLSESLRRKCRKCKMGINEVYSAAAALMSCLYKNSVSNGHGNRAVGASVS